MIKKITLLLTLMLPCVALAEYPKAIMVGDSIMSNAVAGQFRLHELPTGSVWELVFVNKEDMQ